MLIPCVVCDCSCLVNPALMQSNDLAIVCNDCFKVVPVSVVCQLFKLRVNQINFEHRLKHYYDSLETLTKTYDAFRTEFLNALEPV